MDAGMSDLRLAGALWIAAGITCAGLLVFVFVVENTGDPGVLLRKLVLPALVLGGAIAGSLIGSLLVRRPSPRVVQLSNALGVAWLLGFGPLVLTGLNGRDSGPLVSSSMIAGFGIAGALVAYWRHRSYRSDLC